MSKSKMQSEFAKASISCSSSSSSALCTAWALALVVLSIWSHADLCATAQLPAAAVGTFASCLKLLIGVREWGHVVGVGEREAGQGWLMQPKHCKNLYLCTCASQRLCSLPTCTPAYS